MTDGGELISAVAATADAWRDPEYPPREAAVAASLRAPNRFTEEALAYAVNQQMHELVYDKLERWIDGRQTRSPRRVGVLNAGNIPFVELQDFLAVLLIGHQYYGVLSSSSPALLPAFTSDLATRAGNIPIEFGTLDHMLGVVDAVIATGSDTTRMIVAERCDQAGIRDDLRLLRGNRYGVGVLDGNESQDELEGFAEDMLLHEGLGCRNLAIVWAPADASPDPVLEALAAFRAVFPPHPDTPGTLAMQEAFLEASGIPHAYGENLEFLVSRGRPVAQNPGHVRWTEYGPMEDVNRWLREREEELQLVIASERVQASLRSSLPLGLPGTSQRPELGWSPDGVDVVSFLAGIQDGK